MRGRRSGWIPNDPDAYLASKAAQPPPSRPWQPREMLAPGYLRRGYGNVKKWPFSKEKAFLEPGYQRGVRRAAYNPAYAAPWRQAAQKRLREVEEMEAAEEARRIYDAERAESPIREDYPAEVDYVVEQQAADQETWNARLRARRYFPAEAEEAVSSYYAQTGTAYSGVGKKKRRHNW